MGCCQKCAKVYIGLFNGIIVIAAIIIGVVMYVKYHDDETVEFSSQDTAGVVLLVAAIVAVVSALIGLLMLCCGKKCCKILYTTIIVIALVFEIVVIVVAAMYTDKIEDALQEHWYDDDETKYREEMEDEFECCGWAEGYALTDQKRTEGVCGCQKCDGYPFSTGVPETVQYCRASVEDAVKDNVKLIWVGGIVLAVLQLLLLLFSLVLLCSSGSGGSSDIAKF